MLVKRSVSMLDVSKLQNRLILEQKIDPAYAAIETEYALFRTSDEVFAHIIEAMDGNSSASAVINGVNIREAAARFDGNEIAALLLAGTEITDEVKALSDKLEATFGAGSPYATLFSVCALSGYEKGMTDILNQFADGSEITAAILDGMTLSEIKNEFAIDDFAAICIAGIATDNNKFLDMNPSWELMNDTVETGDILPTGFEKDKLPE